MIAPSGSLMTSTEFGEMLRPFWNLWIGLYQVFGTYCGEKAAYLGGYQSEWELEHGYEQCTAGSGYGQRCRLAKHPEGTQHRVEHYGRRELG